MKIKPKQLLLRCYANKVGDQWVRHCDGNFFKVTVDCPKSPFSQDLISSMAKQAGVSKKEFYAARR